MHLKDLIASNIGYVYKSGRDKPLQMFDKFNYMQLKDHIPPDIVFYVHGKNVNLYIIILGFYAFPLECQPYIYLTMPQIKQYDSMAKLK